MDYRYSGCHLRPFRSLLYAKPQLPVGPISEERNRAFRSLLQGHRISHCFTSEASLMQMLLLQKGNREYCIHMGKGQLLSFHACPYCACWSWSCLVPNFLGFSAALL